MYRPGKLNDGCRFKFILPIIILNLYSCFKRENTHTLNKIPYLDIFNNNLSNVRVK